MEQLIKQSTDWSELIALAKDTRHKVTHEQAGVGTFFQLTLIRFANHLEMLLDSYGSQENAEAAVPAEELMELKEKAEQLGQILKRRESGRFVDWQTRKKHHGNLGKDRSEIGFFETLSSQGQFECLTWKGFPLFKSAFDYAILPMLIFELKPKTIIELGSGAGASAIWLSDTAKSFNLKTHIYSVDIEKPNLKYENVTFMEGDCFQIDQVLNKDFLLGLPKPFLIIEDAHANVLEVMQYFDKVLSAGDYFMIEDSSPKRDVLDQFMNICGDAYRVDTLYTDLFGKNSVSAYDSIFKKI